MVTCPLSVQEYGCRFDPYKTQTIRGLGVVQGRYISYIDASVWNFNH